MRKNENNTPNCGLESKFKNIVSVLPEITRGSSSLKQLSPRLAKSCLNLRNSSKTGKIEQKIKNYLDAEPFFKCDCENLSLKT